MQLVFVLLLFLMLYLVDSPCFLHAAIVTLFLFLYASKHLKKKSKEYIENLIQESLYKRSKRDFRTPVNIWAPNIFEFLLSDLTLNGYSWWYSASLLRRPLPRHDSHSALLKIIFSFKKNNLFILIGGYYFATL